MTRLDINEDQKRSACFGGTKGPNIMTRSRVGRKFWIQHELTAIFYCQLRLAVRLIDYSFPSKIACYIVSGLDEQRYVPPMRRSANCRKSSGRKRTQNRGVFSMPVVGSCMYVLYRVCASPMQETKRKWIKSNTIINHPVYTAANLQSIIPPRLLHLLGSERTKSSANSRYYLEATHHCVEVRHLYRWRDRDQVVDPLLSIVGCLYLSATTWTPRWRLESSNWC